MNDNDKQKIVALCHRMIEKGHEYKKMAENPVFQKMFNIQNSKEYALGMILGSYIQTIDDYFKVNYDREIDEDERAFMIALFQEFAPKIISSLFK